MNVADMEVLHAQVAQRDLSSTQLLQLEAKIDLHTQATIIHWYNVSKEGIRSEASFASATVRFEDPAAWQTEWARVTHLVNGRIQALSRMAADCTANKLSKNMAYTLFKNVVDYSDKYRGMQSVVLSEYEAYADISLVPERHGSWHTPPHWIDSVFHLAGLIMNGSDASNTKDFFYVTPGWGSCRMDGPLKPGVGYRSYVRMFLTEEPNMHAGDIYVLQDDVIVAMMGVMKFRRVPRLLMEQFFSPPDLKKKSTAGEVPAKPVATTTAAAVPALKKAQPATVPPLPDIEAPAVSASRLGEKVPGPASEMSKPTTIEAATPAIALANSVIADCLRLIAGETGLDVDELTDDASFIELGVDSLMSLVLSEKFRSELRLDVKSSVFIECSNIGELKEWLEQYC